MKKIISTLIITLVFYAAQAQTGNVGVGTSAPGSKLTVNGSFASPYRIETSTSANIGANDFYIAYNGASAGTLTLPTAATSTLGRTYHIKNTSSAALTVSAAAAGQIDNQTGAGVTSITLQPGYYAFIISKGTTSGTTWEVALIGSADAAAKPQMIVIGTTASNNGFARLAAPGTTALNNDVITVNTIPSATYTASVGATPGFVTVPAGTYLVTMLLDAGFGSGTSSSNISGPGTLPVHSFFYDFPNSTRRVHTNTSSNFGGTSNMGVQIQCVVTVASTSNFQFVVGWGQGGNVNTGSSYDFGKSTQLSIMRLL